MPAVVEAAIAVAAVVKAATAVAAAAAAAPPPPPPPHVIIHAAAAAAGSNVLACQMGYVQAKCWSLQFIMAIDQNISELTERIFMTVCHHSLLLSRTKYFNSNYISQIPRMS